MKIRSRWLARLMVASVIALAAGAFTVAPASAAGSGCTPVIDNADVCVHVQSGAVYGDVGAYQGYFQKATVYVRQCRTDITHCGVIAANTGYNTTFVRTSSKPAPYGHVFHACASWTDNLNRSHTNVCGPWRSWP